MQVILADIILFLLQILMYYYYSGLNLHLNATERTQMYGLYRTARVASFLPLGEPKLVHNQRPQAGIALLRCKMELGSHILSIHLFQSRHYFSISFTINITLYDRPVCSKGTTFGRS